MKLRSKLSRTNYDAVSMRYKRAVENFHFKKERNLLKLNSKNLYRHLNKKLCTHIVPYQICVNIIHILPQIMTKLMNV